jgi:hypothetical protein
MRASEQLISLRNQLRGHVAGDLPMPGPGAMADMVRCLDAVIPDVTAYEQGVEPVASEAALILWWRALSAAEQAGAIALMDATTAAVAAGDHAVMDIIATLAPAPALDVTPDDVIPVVGRGAWCRDCGGLAPADGALCPHCQCPMPTAADYDATATGGGAA